ncbi:hypothetical protein [Leptospira yasudae]|nr:hypothetical protein [Leptospira yasudae]
MEAWLSILTNPISEWDAVSIWYQKAEAYYTWTPLQNLPIVNYPNLGSAYWSFILFFTDNKEAFGRFLFPLTYVVFICEIYHTFKEFTKPIFLSSGLVFLMFYLYDDSFTNGYQDGFLFSIAGIGFLHLLKSFFILEKDKKDNKDAKKFIRSFFLSLFILSALGLLKNEGIVLSLIIASPSVIFLSIHKIRNYPLLLSIFFIYFIILFLWPICLKFSAVDISNLQGNAFNLRSLQLIPDRFDRLPVILEYLKIYLLKNSTLLLISVCISAFSLWFKPKNFLFFMVIWGILILHTAFTIIAFMSTNQDLQWHLDTAFSRLMFQHDFIFPILLALGIFDFSKKEMLSESSPLPPNP